MPQQGKYPIVKSNWKMVVYLQLINFYADEMADYYVTMNYLILVKVKEGSNRSFQKLKNYPNDV